MTGLKILCDCQFSNEDDFSYLEDQPRWLRRLSYRISPDEIKASVVQVIQNMISEIERNPSRLDIIIEKVFSRGAEHTYLAEVKLGDLDFNQRKEIEACFVATIFRYVILVQTPADKRDTKEDRERFRAMLKGDYAEFMQQETGNDNELTWLYRFERAILLAKSYINGNRNKGLFLSVGNLLEGSDDFTRYITGGHSSRETKRRVLLIEHLCEIKPRKRTRKLAAEAPIQRKPKKETGNGGLLQLANIASAMELKEFDHSGCKIERLKLQNHIYELYEGKLVKTSSDVKLKSYSRSFAALFHRECLIMKKLNARDCVMQMIEYSDEEDSLKGGGDDSDFGNKLFIVFESFPQQRTISDVIGFPATVIINILIDLLEVVAYIHGRGIIIKNLRPENILIIGPYYNTRVKIGDFTHAIDITDNTVRLSPELEMEAEDLLMEESLFIAPELCLKEKTHDSEKTDVWSIGMIMYYLFSGSIPYSEIVDVTGEMSNSFSESKAIVLLLSVTFWNF